MPNNEELTKFKRELEQSPLETIKENLRHGHYNSWKTREAEAKVKKEEDAAEYKIKNENLEHQAEGNKIAQEGNKIAYGALCISVVALLVSIFALFK